MQNYLKLVVHSFTGPLPASTVRFACTPEQWTRGIRCLGATGLSSSDEMEERNSLHERVDYITLINSRIYFSDAPIDPTLQFPFELEIH